MYLIWWGIFQAFCPFFWWYCFFYCCLLRVLCLFWIMVFCSVSFANIFSTYVACPLILLTLYFAQQTFFNNSHFFNWNIVDIVDTILYWFQIYSIVIQWLYTLLKAPKKFLILMRSSLSIFFFHDSCLWCYI